MISGPQLIHLIGEGCKRAGLSVSGLFRRSGVDYSLKHYWSEDKRRPTARSVDKLRHGLMGSAASLASTALSLPTGAENHDRPPFHGDIRDDVFGMCALLAYVELANRYGAKPPARAVQKRAYELYEEENARENGARRDQPPSEDAL